MTEATYDALWEFTKEHKDYKDPDGRPQALAILDLYNELSEKQIPLSKAMDVEEACHCIRMALRFAF